MLYRCLSQHQCSAVQTYFLHSQVRMMGMKNTSHSMVSSGALHYPIHAVEGYSNCKESYGWNSETCSLNCRPGCGLGRRIGGGRQIRCPVTGSATCCLYPVPYTMCTPSGSRTRLQDRGSAGTVCHGRTTPAPILS